MGTLAIRRGRGTKLAGLCVLTMLAGSLGAQPASAAVTPTRLVSTTDAGTSGNGVSSMFVPCGGRMIAADTDESVAFTSRATDLVTNDTYGHSQVYVRDLLYSSTEPVSVTPNGAFGNGDSTALAISYTGKFVVFMSVATDLVPGDTNGIQDIFVRDLEAGVTVRASVATNGAQANAPSFCADVSNYGITVFSSAATNLVPGINNGVVNIYRRDAFGFDGSGTSIVSGKVGAQANGSSDRPRMDASDDEQIAFESTASNLIQADQNAVSDVFIKRTSTGGVFRVSTQPDGSELGTPSGDPSLSWNGRFVTFVTGQIGSEAVFVRDRSIDKRVTLDVPGNSFVAQISVDAAGNPIPGMHGQVQTDDYGDPRMRFSFDTLSSQLDPGDSNQASDVAVATLQMDAAGNFAGVTARIASVDANGSVGNSGSLAASIDMRGEWVVFESSSTNLVSGDANNLPDVFAHTTDAELPRTDVREHPDEYTQSHDAYFVFSAYQAATYECSLDGAVLTPCASPKEYSHLSVRTHTFDVRATDVAGNVEGTPDGGHSFVWTIDDSPPTLQFVSPPSPGLVVSPGAGGAGGQSVGTPAGPTVLVGPTRIKVKAKDDESGLYYPEFTIDGKSDEVWNYDFNYGAGEFWFTFNKTCPQGCTITARIFNRAGGQKTERIVVTSVQLCAVPGTAGCPAGAAGRARIR